MDGRTVKKATTNSFSEDKGAHSGIYMVYNDLGTALGVYTVSHKSVYVIFHVMSLSQGGVGLIKQVLVTKLKDLAPAEKPQISIGIYPTYDNGFHIPFYILSDTVNTAGYFNFSSQGDLRDAITTQWGQSNGYSIVTVLQKKKDDYASYSNFLNAIANEIESYLPAHSELLKALAQNMTNTPLLPLKQTTFVPPQIPLIINDLGTAGFYYFVDADPVVYITTTPFEKAEFTQKVVRLWLYINPLEHYFYVPDEPEKKEKIAPYVFEQIILAQDEDLGIRYNYPQDQIIVYTSQQNLIARLPLTGLLTKG